MSNWVSTLPALLEGIKLTLEVFALTLAFSLPLGVLVALFRISPWRILRTATGGFIWLMRGTPLLLQLLFVYYFLPTIGIKISDFPSAIITFVLNYAAYFAEIFRGGIQSIDRGQYEAARTLGMDYPQTMRRIVLPQMMRLVLPPVTNETITLVKDTSLIYILAMNDLLRVTRSMVQREFDLTPFLIAGSFYLLFTLLLTWLFNHLENRYRIYDR